MSLPHEGHFNINLYQEMGAFFGDELGGERAKYIIGNEDYGWTYATFFNSSVLGAEFYLNNYIRLKGKFCILYLRYGFPFQNIGTGILLSDLVCLNKFKMDLNFDLWNQEFYGKGFSLAGATRYMIDKNFEVIFQPAFKSKGYMLGMPINGGVTLNFMIKYYIKMNNK